MVENLCVIAVNAAVDVVADAAVDAAVDVVAAAAIDAAVDVVADAAIDAAVDAFLSPEPVDPAAARATVYNRTKRKSRIR